ncbi:neurochondrin-like [Archocentrus centrarchus]|uniref:neurochondrin-like n=1 Tax=Archocentrus centrarchus TaxID=63155 RepID=UPI0011EA3840|nr:neurochondrin-like [Archocentrus centrarchus]
MADRADVTPTASSQPPGREEQGGGEDGGSSEGDANSGLTDAQRQVLERCVHALTHATNDSQMLAALLLISRLCPASDLDKPTLKRIFEAVGLSLPVRLLLTAVRGGENSGLPPRELLSLGIALLAALSTEPDMACNPELLRTIPLLLSLLANGFMFNQQKQEVQEEHQMDESPECNPAGGAHSAQEAESSKQKGDDGSEASSRSAAEEDSLSCSFDAALAADCYLILTAVCTLPRGPEQLLSRGAVAAVCQAVQLNRPFSRDRGLVVLGFLLSGKNKDKAWRNHTTELLSLVIRLSKDFCQSTNETRLDMCAQLAQFLPPAGVATENERLKEAVRQLWEVLRPMVQAKLTQTQIGPILVLCACLLDLYGWDIVGPPKFCCLLVNRACVEVRLGLEAPPGNDLSPELQDTLTGCYRIMEAAIEQACSPGVPQGVAPPQSALSLQQSRQILRVLEEAFSALIYYLQQVDQSRYGDPFVFATFRSLCSWLAEETSCLKKEVTGLLPFLISYTQSHLHRGSSEQGLADWMAKMSADVDEVVWTGREALRYLLPALCHLSAEKGPRKVLLDLDTPTLLVDFLTQSWVSLKRKSSAASARDPSMETACSALLNFIVTEPERVRKDSCFRSLESLLSEALPLLVNKPRLLVLTANCCTLGLMLGRLTEAGAVEVGQRRFLSAALRFLCSALDSSSSPGPLKVSLSWEDSWDDAAELWRLSLQALGGCVRAQPSITTLIREEGWLKNMLTMLCQCSALPDQLTQDALEEALCVMAERCPVCKQEIGDMMRRCSDGALSNMKKLEKSVGLQ